MIPGCRQKGEFYNAVLLQNVDCYSLQGSKIDLMVFIHHFFKK